MLTPLQLRLAERLLSLPGGATFALAGGAALVLQQLVERRTRDLDLFTDELAVLPGAIDEFVSDLRNAGLSVEVEMRTPSFARLRVADGADETLIDLGFDAREFEPISSAIGPILAPQELAADKLLALFGRAEARDFLDVFALQARFGLDAMIEWAHAKDRGFDTWILAGMVGRLESLPRVDFELSDQEFHSMVDFYAAWREQLIATTLAGDS